MKATNTRLPDELHRLATAYVGQCKQQEPGYSLNTLIVHALREYLQRRAKAPPRQG